VGRVSSAKMTAIFSVELHGTRREEDFEL